MTTRKKKTAYDKVQALIQHSPGNAILKTGLRHFSDEALVRELQRRDALPKATDVFPFLNDSELIVECHNREMLAVDMKLFKRAIDEKDWDAILELYWRD